MKIIKTASGNKIKMSKSEWETMGKKAGWMKEAVADYLQDINSFHPAELLTYEDIPVALARLGKLTDKAREYSYDEGDKEFGAIKGAFEKNGLTREVADDFLKKVQSVTNDLKPLIS